MARPDKAAAVAELTDKFRSSNAAVLTEYRGLTVAQLKTLRRSLGENAQYAVVKNTLTKIAANEAGITTLDDLFNGPTAVAFVTGDPVTSAKGLRDFAKDNPNLVIKGGVLDGKALSADDGNTLVRQGVLRLLSTISRVSVAHSVTKGEATLTITAPGGKQFVLHRG